MATRDPSHLTRLMKGEKIRFDCGLSYVVGDGWRQPDGRILDTGVAHAVLREYWKKLRGVPHGGERPEAFWGAPESGKEEESQSFET